MRLSVDPAKIASAVELSVANFLNGYNCAESVLLAMSKAMGMDSEIVPAVATGFGAGYGQQGLICGAISGAVMAMGLARGRSTAEDKEGKEEAYALTQILYRRFLEKFGTTTCKELLKEDISTPEGQKAAFEKRLRETQCIQFVAFATQTALELLAGTKSGESVNLSALDG